MRREKDLTRRPLASNAIRHRTTLYFDNTSANAIAVMAEAEMLSDHIVTRAQGKQGDSRVLQGT